MFTFLNRIYVIDFKHLVELSNYSERHSVKDIEKIDSYEPSENGNFEMFNKTIREYTTNSNEHIDNMSYDFLKELLMIIVNYGDRVNTGHNETLPVGVEIAVRTLIREKILIEIDDEGKETVR